MKENKTETKIETKYIAVLHDSAFTGIGIINFDYGIEDYCITEYFSQTEKKKAKNKIYSTSKGRSYIVKYGKRYYLDEFIRL